RPLVEGRAARRRASRPATRHVTSTRRRWRRRMAVGLVAVATLAACSDSKPSAHDGGNGSGGGPAFTDSGSYGPIEAGTTAAPPAPPKNPDGGTKDLPGSIDHDCQSDVTDALNKAIDGIPDNSTIRFAENGCYRLDGTLTLDKRNRLLLDGRGATLKAGVTGG